MSAATISVQSTSDAQIDDLAFYISRLRGESEDDAPYVKEIQTLMKSDKNSVYTQLAKDVSILLTKNDREVEHAFNLTIVILLGAPEQVLPEAVKALTSSLSNTESTKTSLKQKILLNLYNALPTTSALRYDAFLALVNVTAQADDLSSLTGQLANVDSWVKQWGIDLATERQLYQHVSEKLDQAGEKKASLDFLLKKLSTYQTQDDASTECANQVITRAVALDTYFSFEDLVPCVQPHIKDPNAPAAKLLDLYLNGNVQAYQAAITDQDDAAGLRKIRLLSLASLGSENLARELTYGEISTALAISEDEVEMWVIDVIRAGLVEAKLDQLNKTVIVHRSIYRVFGKDQWRQLSERLNTWKNSLNDILAVIGNAKLMTSAVVVEDKSEGVKTH
ncbi:hypothetical protein [Absidia glauca]|uniref:Eukaryotic translation initiation factor 3 subunit M n=1 Tax=Absidia glauca TaxID=4829 RepID=A0A168MF28_ABSGL|nr:hypothetical protein [Absidia glauca]